MPRHPEPAAAEIRFWAIVWIAIALAVVAVPLAVVFFG
jgi:hypothetical protein